MFDVILLPLFFSFLAVVSFMLPLLFGAVIAVGTRSMTLRAALRALVPRWEIWVQLACAFVVAVIWSLIDQPTPHTTVACIFITMQLCVITTGISTVLGIGHRRRGDK